MIAPNPLVDISKKYKITRNNPILPTMAAQQIIKEYQNRELYFCGKFLAYDVGNDALKKYLTNLHLQACGIYPLVVKYNWLEKDKDKSKYTDNQDRIYTDLRKLAIQLVTNIPYYIDRETDTRDIISLGYSKGHPYYNRKVKNTNELDQLLNDKTFTSNKRNDPNKYVLIYDYKNLSRTYKNYIDKVLFEKFIDRDILFVIGATSLTDLSPRLRAFHKTIFAATWDDDVLSNYMNFISKFEGINITVEMEKLILKTSNGSIYEFFDILQKVYDAQMSKREKK